MYLWSTISTLVKKNNLWIYFFLPLQMSTARFKPGVSLTLSRFLITGLMFLNFAIKLCNSLHIDPYLETDNIRTVSIFFVKSISRKISRNWCQNNCTDFSIFCYSSLILWFVPFKILSQWKCSHPMNISCSDIQIQDNSLKIL